MAKIPRLRGVAALAVLTLAAAACGGGGDKGKGDATGVTADTVTIGSHYPLTGPAAPGYSKIGPAAKAYFDYVNANGGVNGRKIVFKYMDDAYNPTQTVQVVRRLVLQDKVFAIMGGLGTPTHTKVVDFLNQSKVPDLFVASGCLCWNDAKAHPYTFGWQPDYVVEGKILGQYVKDHFAGKRVAYFSQNDDFGKDGVKGLDTFVPQSQVVSRQTYQPGNLDVGPQVSAIAAAKADVVVAFTIPAYTALLRLTSLKLNYNPQLVVTNVGSDRVTLAGLLESFAKSSGATVRGTQLIEGMISDAYLPPYHLTGQETDSWVQLFRKVHQQYIPKIPYDGNVEYGMAQAYTFVQALQKAGKNPTRQSLLDAVEGGGLSGPGLVPFRYSKDSHAGYTGVQMYVVSKGETSPLGDRMTTDDGSGPVQPYTQRPAQAPANGVPAS